MQGAELILPGNQTMPIAYIGPSINGSPQEHFSYDINDFPVYLISDDLSDDTQACSALPPSTPDLADHVVLVRMSNSSCNPTEQYVHVTEFGAQFVLFYTDNPTTLASDTYYIVLTSTTVAQIVKDAMESSNSTVGFTSSGEAFVGLYQENFGGLPCSTTGWGPTYGLDLKPDIMAPAYILYSTYLYDKYTYVAGTDLSSAYVAGVAALYLSANPMQRKSAAGVRQYNYSECQGVTD